MNDEEIFKILPQNKTYKLGNKGTLINVKTGYKKVWTKGTQGYYYTDINAFGASFKLLRGLALLTLFGTQKPDENYTCDHINRERDDDRLENLRWCTKSQQNLNQKYSNGLPEYILRNGNFPQKSKKEYKFEIVFNKKRFHCYFYTVDEAIAYRNDFLSKNSIILL